MTLWTNYKISWFFFLKREWQNVFSALYGARTGVVSIEHEKSFCDVFTRKIFAFVSFFGWARSIRFGRKMANDDTVDLFWPLLCGLGVTNSINAMYILQKFIRFTQVLTYFKWGSCTCAIWAHYQTSFTLLLKFQNCFFGYREVL